MQVKTFCRMCGCWERTPSLTYLCNQVAGLGTVRIEHVASEFCVRCQRSFVNAPTKEATLRRYATALAAARPTIGRTALKGELEKLAAQLKRF